MSAAGAATVAELLLELHAAASPFVHHHQPTRSRRDALRAAIVRLHLALRTAPSADLIRTPAEALAALDHLLERCETLGVPWPEIVAQVNRGVRHHD